MGKRFYDTEERTGVELEVSLDGETYFWIGNYDLVTSGETQDDDYMGDSESEIKNVETDSIQLYHEESDSWTELKEVPKGVMMEIIWELEKIEGI